MSKMLVDIIIVNYNSTDCILQCLESVYEYLKPNKNKIIVVDNYSKDDPDRIIQKYSDIILIKNSENYGFAQAVNIALKLTTSDLLLLLNPDTVVLEDSLCEMFDYMSQHNDVAISAPMILDQDRKIQGSARRFPTVWTSFFGRKSPLTKLFPNNPITKREFICFSSNTKTAQSVDWVSGACMVIRREAIERVDGFDENFFLYWEDTDLCKRMKNEGWKIIYYPKAKVIHTVGESSNTRPIVSIFHFHYSCYKLFKKHNRNHLQFMAPIIIFGLVLRCGFAMVLNIAHRGINLNPKGRMIIDTEKSYQSKKIKILRVVSRLNIGGPSIHVSLLSKNLTHHKYSTKLVIGKISASEGDMSYLVSHSGVSIHRIDELQRELHPIKDIIAFWKLFRLILLEKPNIVHTHMAKAGTLARLSVCLYNLLFKDKIKIVHTFHGHVFEGYFSKTKSSFFMMIERFIGKFTDAIIAISNTQKWEITEKYRIATPKKVHTISLGFNLNRFRVLQKIGQLKSEFGFSNDDLLIGIVGRLVPIKNHFMFLDAARILSSELYRKSLRFVIIGDGELRADLEKYVKKIGMQGKVTFAGWQHDLSKVYADLDILALTSMNEGTPVSIIEAMASSVPVITTGVGGVKDLLGNFVEMADCKENGFKLCERGIVCNKEDPVSFSNGIKFLIDNNISKDSAMSKMARQYVLQNYTEKALIDRIEALYESLVHNTI